MPSGPKKRRAARNKNRGNQNNGTDLEGEENAFIESTSMEVQDGLAVKNAATHVELATPIDAVSSKEVVLNQNVGSKDVLELGSKENDGKEVTEHVLDSSLEEGKGKEPPSEVLDSSLEEGKGKELPWEVLDSSLEEGKGKELHVEVLDSGPKENDDKPVEENALVEPILTEVEDRLVVMNDAAYVELAEPVDALSPRGIILVQDVGSKDGFEFGSKENDGKDVLEHVLDSSLEEEGKGKPSVEVLDSGPKENDEVKENALIEQTSIEVEDELAVKNDAANYVELAEPDEALSPRGIVFVRDVGSEDVFELGLKEKDGKEVIKEVLDSSLEEDDGKELPAEVLDLGPILKVEENALIKPTSIEVEDGLAVKTTAANVELSEPIDALFSKEAVQNVGSEDVFELGSKEVDVKEVIKDVVDSNLDDAFVHDVGSEEVFELGSKENDGKEVIEHVLDLSLEEGEGIEPPLEVLDSGPKENDHKSVEENALIEPASIDQVEDELAEPVDVLSPRGIVLVQDVGSEDVFELGSKENYGKEVSKEVLDSDSSLEEDDGKEPPAEVLDSGPILKVEENAEIKPTSIEVEDGLAVKTTAANVELSEPIDALFSKEAVQNVGSEDVFELGSKEVDVKEVIKDVVDSSLDDAFVYDVGSEEVFELGSKENDGKEVIEHVLDSSLEEGEGIPPLEVLDSGPKENDHKSVGENALIEPTSIDQVEDELAEPVDVLSPRGTVFVQDVGSEDVFELVSNENYGKEVSKEVLDSDSSLEEDDGKEPPAEVLDSGPILKVEENAEIKPTSIEVEDGLAVKTTAANVELSEPIDALFSKEAVQNVGSEDVFELGSKEVDVKEVIKDVVDSNLDDAFVHDVGSVEVFELGSKENDGKEVIELVLDLSLEEGEGIEPPLEVLDSGPKENDHKSVEENALIEPTSIDQVEDELAEPVDVLSPRGIVFVQDVGSEDVFELGSKENYGKEVSKEVLDSDSSLEEDDGKEPPAEVLDSGPILKVEENAEIKPTSIKVEDGLAVKTTAANVELSEPIDALFSKEAVQNVGSEDVFELGSKEVDVKEVIKDVVDSSLDDAFVHDVGSEEVFELGSKENDGKEVIEHVLDLSLEEGEGIPPLEVLDSGPKENDHKSVEENALIEPTSIDQVEDELAEPIDVLSPRGTVFVQDVGSEEVFELVSNENYGKEVSKEVLDSDSSLEEDDGKEPPAEVLDSGPILKVEENALIEPTSIEVEDGLAVKTAAADVELAEPVDAVSSKEVILVQNVGSEYVFDMGSKEIDVKEVIEDSLDSSLGEDEWKEPPVKVLDSSPMENDEKPVEQSTFIEPTLVEVEDGLVVKTIAADVEVSEPIDVLFSKEVVLAQNLGSEDVSELGSNEIDVKEVNEDVLDSSLKEDELNETPAEVPDSGPKENDEKPVEESGLIESTPIEVEDVLVVEPVTADVDQLVEPVDAHSSKGVLLVQDEGFEYAFELGSNVSDETEVFEDVLDSSPEKDEGSKPPAEVRMSDPNENDGKQVEENVLIKPTSIELEDGLAVKTAAEDVELAEPVDAIVTKEIVLVQDVGSEDIFELGLNENEGEDVIKDVLDFSLEKDEGKEPPAEVNGSGPKENDEKPVEEDDLTKPTSIEVEDGLVVDTAAANVELAEPVDALSSEGVLLAKNVGSEDVFELASKEEVIEDVLDSSLEEDDGKESPSEVLDTGPILKDEENAFIDPTSIKGEDGLVVKTASTDVELAESVDVLSSRGFLVQDVGSEDVSELGLKENYGGEVIKHVLDSSLEEDEQKEPHIEILDSGPKENVDKPAAESAFINPMLVEVEDGLAVKIAAGDVELAEPVDNISSRGVILVQDVGSEDVSALGSKENDGREVIEDVLDSSLAEDEQKEQHVEILDSGPKENDDKPVGDSALIEPTSVKMEDAMAVETAAGDVELAEPLDDISSRGVVLVQDIGSEDVLELGSEESDGKDLTEDVLDSSLENDKRKEPLAEVNEIRPKEKDNEPVEEDALVKTTSIELEDGLALTTAADVELAEPVDTLSKRSVLVQDGGFEDVFELGLKEKDEKEVEDVLDSSLEKDEGKEPPCEVNDSCLKENVDNPVEKNVIIEPNAIKLDDGLALTTGVDDAELAEPVDALSSKGVAPFQDIRFEDVFQLGYEENDDNPVEEDALIAPNSIELEHGSALTTAAIDVELAGSVDALSYEGVSFVQDRGFEGVFELGLEENDDKPVEENALIEPNPIELEDGFALTTAAAEVELAEPVVAVSSKEVNLVQDISSEDVSQLGSEENDGKEVIEDVLDSSLEKVVGKEPPVEFNDSGLKENDEKPVEEDGFIEPTSIELELEDGLGVTTASDVELAEPLDALSSEGVVLDRDVGFEDVFEFVSKENDGKEVIEDVFDSSSKEDDGEEPHAEVLGSGPVLKVEEDALSGPTSIELELEDGLAATTVRDVEFAEPVDALSSKGVALDRDGGFEDVSELGSKENDGKEETEDDVLDSSSEEDDEEEPPEQVLGSGSILKVLFSKYFFTLLCIVVVLVVWKQQFVLLLSTCSTGSSWSPLLSPIGPHLHEYHSMETDEALVLENADDVAELSEPPDTCPSKGDVLEICSKKDNGKDLFEGKELAEEVLDSGLTENEGNEPALEVLELISRENGGKPIVEDPLTDEFELASDSKETVGVELASVDGGDPLDSPYVVEPAGSMEDDSVLSREVVNFLESRSNKNAGTDFLEGKKAADEVLDLGPKENEGKEQADDVIDSGPNEIDNKPVVEDPSTDELELASKETERKELTSVVGGDTLHSPSLVESDSTEDHSFLSKEVVQNVLELGSKKDEGRELVEEVLELGQKENVDQPKVEDPLANELELASDSNETEGKEMASVLGGDPLDSPSVVSPIASVEDDTVLSREVVQNVLELGSKKNDGNELLEGKEPAEELLDSRWNENDDKPVVEDPLTDEFESAPGSKETKGKELASVVGGDTLDSSYVVELADSTEDDSILSKEVVQNAFIKEPAEEVLDSVLNENDDKSVVEDPLTDELELKSDSQEIKQKELAFVVGGDPLDSPSVDDSTDSMEGDSVVSEELNQKASVENKVAKRNLGADGEDLLALVKGVRKTIEEQLIVVEEMRVSLRHLLDSVNLIRTTIQG